MKLALIRRQFSATGGAELYLQRLMAALVEAGHEAHLFAEAWSGQARGVRFHAVPVSGTRATRPLRFAAAVKELAAREPFDCVFSLERTLQQDVYRAGDGVHRVWLERRRRFAPWWKRLLVGRGAFHRNMLALEARTFDPANTRRIIVNSNMVKGEILRHFPFPEERIHLVRNGVDVKRFQSGKRAETRARFGVKDDEFLLLFVGSGWERKGLRCVFQALDELRSLLSTQPLPAHLAARSLQRTTGCFGPHPIKLLIVGRDRPRVAFPEFVVHAGTLEDIQDAYAAADLFVFPPLYEPSSNAVYEALAAGLPVVTTASNGASEVIEPELTGSIVKDPADPRGLAEEILRWYSRGAPKRVWAQSNLSLERNLMETLDVLEEAAREKHG